MKLFSERSILFEYTLICVCFGVLYGISCAPGYLWQDSGLIQYRSLNGDFIGPFGLALSHPLYYVFTIGITKILPGAFPYSINLLSSFFATITIANVYLLVRIWTNARTPALISAISLGVAHTFWAHACIAETYSLWAFLFSLELLCLLFYDRFNSKGALLCLVVFNGLSLSVHNLSLLSLVCYTGLIAISVRKKKTTTKTALSVLLLWLLSSSLLLSFIIHDFVVHGSLSGTIQSALFGTQWQDNVLNHNLSAKFYKTSLLYLILNFPTLNLLLVFVYLFSVIKKGGKVGCFSWTTIALLGVFLGFSLRYDVPDRYVFFLPCYMLLALFLGAGAHILSQTAHAKRIELYVLILSFTPIAAYVIIPSAAQKAQYRLDTRGDVPYRDDFKYFLQPWKGGYQGAKRFAHESLNQVEPNSLICADMTTVTPLLLMQEHEGMRPDVQIINSTLGKQINWESPGQVDKILEQSPLYIVSHKPGYCPKPLLDYPVQSDGILWRVMPSNRSSID